ncbi:MAG: ATP-binding protein [Candidatus Pacearchaeota archaeon]|jgi:signal transduction histidine kinase
MEPDYRTLVEENRRLRGQIGDLELQLANFDVRESHFLHDFKGPLATLMMLSLDYPDLLQRLHDAEDPQVAKSIEFKLRQMVRRSDAALGLLNDHFQIASCRGMSTEQLMKYAEKFDLLKKLKQIFDAHEHPLIRSDLGLTFDYSPSLENFEVYANVGALSSPISNLVSNAIKYATPRGSVIKAMAYLSEDSFGFELENAVRQPIDVAELQRFFEFGYTRGEIDSREAYGRSQGIGLTDARDLLITLGASVELSSDHYFQITEERAEEGGFRRKNYGIIPPQREVPRLPSFHAKVSIPLEYLKVPEVVVEDTTDEEPPLFG